MNMTKNIKVAILGDYSTQFITKALKKHFIVDEYDLDTFEITHDDIKLEIINKESGLYKFKPDYVFIMLSAHAFKDQLYSCHNRKSFYVEYALQLEMMISTLRENTSAKIVITGLYEYNDMTHGNYSNVLESSLISQIRRFNLEVIEKVRIYNCLFLDIVTIQCNFMSDNFIDYRMYYLTGAPFSLKATDLISENISSIIISAEGNIKKAIVVDLDNTLWDGIIGEVGYNGIGIGISKSGKIYKDIQLWLMELKERGILLNVVSKNDEEVAKEAFIKNKNMILSLDDICAFVANWDRKSVNILGVANKLHINIDSFVFIDDNPFEREEVKYSIPDISVSDIGEDSSNFLNTIINNNYFEVSGISNVDQNRTQQYATNYKRELNKVSFNNVTSYLTNLNMTGSVFQLSDEAISRVSQLSMRSNQFNLRTIRYSENDLKHLMHVQGNHILYVNLEDRFGNYGTIAAIVIKEINNERLFVENFFMSCRVLQRTVEEFIINEVYDYAFEKGYIKIEGEFISTKKNNLVSDFYTKMGFDEIKKDYYEKDVSREKLITYVRSKQ